ncbi:MAG: hypothetical protein ACLQIB_44535 [Isosphaeraceae bacterium]
MGPGIMLIDRQLVDRLRAGLRAGAVLATIVRRVAWTASESGCPDGKASGREKHCGSVR